MSRHATGPFIRPTNHDADPLVRSLNEQIRKLKAIREDRLQTLRNRRFSLQEKLWRATFDSLSADKQEKLRARWRRNSERKRHSVIAAKLAKDIGCTHAEALSMVQERQKAKRYERRQCEIAQSRKAA